MAAQTFLTHEDFEKAKNTDFMVLPANESSNKVMARAVDIFNTSLKRRKKIANGGYPALLKALDTFEARLKEIDDLKSLEALQDLRERLNTAVRDYLKTGEYAPYLKAIAHEDEATASLLAKDSQVLLCFKMWFFEALDAAKDMCKVLLILPCLVIVPGFFVYDALMAFLTPDEPKVFDQEKAASVRAMFEAAWNELEMKGESEAYDNTVQTLGIALAGNTKEACYWFRDLRLVGYNGDKAKWFTAVLAQAITCLKKATQGLERLIVSPVTAGHQAHTFFSAQKEVRQEKDALSKEWDELKKGPGMTES